MFDALIYLKLGWRNLWLHPMRTGLTVAALATGIAALTFLSAMNDGWLQQIRENFALTLIGHIQIHAQGFEQSRRLRDRIHSVDTVTAALSGVPGIRAWTLRIRASGLASSAGASAGAQVYGVLPSRERGISRLAGFVTRGRWLRDTDDRAVVLGSGLADRLQIGLGDKVVLMVALPDGEIASEVFRVRGILHSGVLDIDDLLAVAPLARVRTWLGMPEDATDVVLRVGDFAQVGKVAALLRQALARKRPGGKALEVLTWSEIDPMAEQWSQFADAYSWVILGVVILVVLAEVVNTMLMSMHERIPEFGLMSALGVQPWQVFAMVVWETVILVLAGSLAGFALGGALAWHFGTVGIDLSRFATAFSFMYMSPVVHPELHARAVLRILLAATFGAMLAGMIPARKAARLSPAEAMRRI